MRRRMRRTRIWSKKKKKNGKMEGGNHKDEEEEIKKGKRKRKSRKGRMNQKEVVLRCNTVQSGESKMALRGNISLPSSGSKNKLSKKPA
jgi:hypothetical protein